ncbi:nuclear transport factor 2 family protein [Microbispora sp. H11081]|uniref:nuclear transport factor 2 family protein n=1 Tax=Microbispora sp. H11081 TaxID=2729107 RepID=UPI001B8AEC78
MPNDVGHISTIATRTDIFPNALSDGHHRVAAVPAITSLRDGRRIRVGDDGEPGTTVPAQTLNGRDKLASAFGGLRTYDKTTHFIGQSTVTVDGDRATGEPTAWRTISGARRGSAPSCSSRSATTTPSSGRTADGFSPSAGSSSTGSTAGLRPADRLRQGVTYGYPDHSGR